MLKSEGGMQRKTKRKGDQREESPLMLFLNKSKFMPQQEAGAFAATWG